jgi:hypothetical protein
MTEARIIIVDANVSLKPYLTAAAESAGFEAGLEKMGFKIREETPGRKIGFVEAVARAENK